MSGVSTIRPGGGLIGVIGLALAVVLAISLFSPASAQTPQSGSCAPPFERGPGGQTISAGLIRVDLTSGYNYIWNAPPVGSLNGTLRICIIEYFSTDHLRHQHGPRDLPHYHHSLGRAGARPHRRLRPPDHPADADAAAAAAHRGGWQVVEVAAAAIRAAPRPSARPTPETAASASTQPPSAR